MNDFIQTDAGHKKATSVTMNRALLQEARNLGVNISQAAEQGVQHMVKEAKAARWLEENAEALTELNAWVDTHGLPLKKFRQF